MAQDDKKKTNVPSSLQPRKKVRKSIPSSITPKTKKTPSPTPVVIKEKPVKPVQEEKERFTLWLSKKTYTAFKIHTATRKGSASEYIEELINKDLKVR